jgi:peptidoglycan/LPS O-acetylase OafA/YrhL
MRIDGPALQPRGSVAGKPPQGEAVKLDYIDAVRGWAILLVMTCHVFNRFAGMPYPIKKLTNFGWHGVQLFFLASAITLAISWARAAHTPFMARTGQFFTRRVFRIAPMYYTGALIYFFLDPPGEAFSWAQLLRTLVFINAWHPDWIPTTPGWMVVPGGWSIGVEFTFYAVFPLLISQVTSRARAGLFIALTVGAAMLLNGLPARLWPDYPAVAIANFTYFWFPNQLPGFALGLLLHHVLLRPLPMLRLGKRASWGFGILVLAGVVLSQTGRAPSHFVPALHAPPILMALLLFAGFVLLLAHNPGTLFEHPAMRRLGVLSFSAYVLHFVFVHNLPEWTGGLIDVRAEGVRAIFMGAMLWLLTVAATVATSEVAHRLIEVPGQQVGRWLLAGRRAAPRGQPA